MAILSGVSFIQKELSKLESYPPKKIIQNYATYSTFLYIWTRQVYNLFQDLWNKAFFRKVQKGAKNGANVYKNLFYLTLFQLYKVT